MNNITEIEERQIAGVIVARDEELNIVHCLECLKPYVGEIILIDMQSVDRTVELARPLASKILSHPIVPVMDVVRHAALTQSKFDWFWFVDADEFVPDHVGRAIVDLVRNHGEEFEALQYPFATHFCGKWMKHCGWWPGYTVPRVLKRGHFKFYDELHRGVRVDGRLLKLDPSFAVPHHSFRDLKHWVSKFNRYTSTEALQLAQRDIHWNWRSALRAMVHDLWEHYELHDAQKDGNLGWILTWLTSQYRWMSFAKLMDNFPGDAQLHDRTSVPASLDEAFDAMQEELSALRAQKPRLPLGVVLAMPLSGSDVSATEGGTFAMLIASGTREVAVRTAHPAESISQGSALDSTLLRALIRARRPKYTMTIVFASAEVAKRDPFSSLNILRLSILNNLVTAEVIANVNTFDEIWVSDEAEINFLRRNWVPAEKLRIVPRILERQGFADQLYARVIEDALAASESRFVAQDLCPVSPSQLRVEIEGELFSFHSFAKINEHLALELQSKADVAVSLRRRLHTPSYDQDSLRTHLLRPLIGREFDDGAQVTIRHAFPPNWDKPKIGKWVHVQPWEYGRLPNDWVRPLSERVDEIWVPSEYVRRVYERSGIPTEKIHVIPWGVDAAVYNPKAPPLLLPTSKSFAFLFVGGVIERKGADIAVQAFLQEFSAHEDVCLVVKDMGSNSFYQDSPVREKLLAAMQNPSNPQIIYLDRILSDAQMASLYTACQCLVAPYRGEGFGLPVLEAMACGVPPIVPSGGSTDDFVDKDCGVVLAAEEVELPHSWNLCGPATQLRVKVEDVQFAMRSAYENQKHLASKGAIASKRVLTNFSWQRTGDLIMQRLRQLVRNDTPPLRNRGPGVLDETKYTTQVSDPSLSAIVVMNGEHTSLAPCLARLAPFVEKLFAIHFGASTRDVAIAEEYGARVYDGSQFVNPIDAFDLVRKAATSSWLLFVNSSEILRDDEIGDILSCLNEAPANMCEVAMQVRSESGASLPIEYCAPLRLLRRDADFVFTNEFANQLLPSSIEACQ